MDRTKLTIDVDGLGERLFHEWFYRTHHERTSKQIYEVEKRMSRHVWHWVAVEAVVEYERQCRDHAMISRLKDGDIADVQESSRSED